MNAPLHPIVGLTILGLAILFIGSVWTWVTWKNLPEGARQNYRKEILTNRKTLLILALLVAIPILVFVLVRLEIYSTFFAVVGTMVWAGLSTWFWEKSAMPLPVSDGELVPGKKPVFAPLKPPPSPHVPGPIVRQPSEITPIPVPIVPALAEDDLVLKNYSWTYPPGNLPQSIEINLSKGRYEQYHQEPRRPAGLTWTHYATKDMPEILALTVCFQNLHLKHEWSTFEQASNVLCFTQQCIPYTQDEESTELSEWPRYPIETLMDGTGDCEDMAILTAAIMVRMGFDVALLIYPNHVALGVAGADGLPGNYLRYGDPKDKRCYFYAESTAKDWRIGEIPEAYKSQSPQIYPVKIMVDNNQEGRG